MACIECGGETHDWFGDNWCDVCHGVMVRRADGSTFRIFRHVANVRGETLGLPVVWDESAKHYLFRWPNKENPRYTQWVANGKKPTEIDFRPTKVLSTFGRSIDRILIQAYDAVRVEGGRTPQLSAAPSATPEERSLVLGV